AEQTAREVPERTENISSGQEDHEACCAGSLLHPSQTRNTVDPRTQRCSKDNSNGYSSSWLFSVSAKRSLFRQDRITMDDACVFEFRRAVCLTFLARWATDLDVCFTAPNFRDLETYDLRAAARKCWAWFVPPSHRNIKRESGQVEPRGHSTTIVAPVARPFLKRSELAF
ncbi:unnamed protein product, partial [Amoebophrya sp. A120]